MDKEICALINKHFSLFGSTQMPLLLSSLAPYKAEADEHGRTHTFSLNMNNNEYFTGLCVDDLVFLVAVLHELNDASMAEVYDAIDLDPTELFEVFSATGMVSIRGARGHQLSHSFFEKSLFKAATYAPPAITPIALKIGFQDTTSLAGMMASGIAEHAISDYLSKAQAEGLADENLDERLPMIGWLAEHCNDIDSLPNQNAAHYIRAIGAFQPALLNKVSANAGWWEEIVLLATARSEDGRKAHPVSQRVMETVASPSYVQLHRAELQWMLNSLVIAEDEDEQGQKPSVDKVHIFLSKRFAGTDLYAATQTPHFLLSLARSPLGRSIVGSPRAPIGFDDLQQACPRIGGALLPYRHDLANAVLKSLLAAPDEQFGLGLLTTPLCLAQLTPESGDKRVKPDILRSYLSKTLPMAAEHMRIAPDFLSASVLDTYRYLVDEALKIKQFDWGFEKQLSEDQRHFLVRSGLPINKLENSNEAMRETAIGFDLGL
ncbi:hypothetical protein [Pseudomonas sp. CFBP 13719]|uniref:hypothetical protein n=1 Tax=Pseudomonas sp. CFBP 13719 TaxID=2775303 RepID=UPI00178776CA|nr:hypothetical protein [Pseudomonas sp. CFBP 13719]MBD8681347.1 hypothetical protein [Pseudomonas sp. CFBP 13719]